MKIKQSVKVLDADAKTDLRRIAYAVLQAVFGFLLANITLSRGIMPFGIAFAANGGVCGIVGSVLGYIVGGRDVFRHVIAAVIAGCAKYAVGNVLGVNREIAVFLFSLWGVMAGGIAGLFLDTFTWTDNVLFMLNGLLSGLLAYVFSVAFRRFTDDTAFTDKTSYICMTVSLASLLLGLLSFGGIWEHAALMLTLFSLYCMLSHFGFMYTCTTAALISMTFFVYRASYAEFCWVLVLAAVLGGLLKNFGKYGILIGAVLADVLVAVYLQFDPHIFLLLFYVLLAGVLFLIMPERAMARVLFYVEPARRSKTPILHKRNGISRFAVKKKLQKAHASVSTEAADEICGKCNRRLYCWTRNYNYTSDMFRTMEKAVGLPNYELPDHFRETCRKPDVILRFLQGKNVAENGYHICFSKTSRQKEGELLCGDTSGIFPTDDNRYIISIADGMGTGTDAARQSVQVSRMMKSLLRRGMEREDVLRILNENLKQGEEESIMGVDIACIDLMTGRCELFKAGAAPTYIIRNRNVFEIGTASLPIGILDEADVARNRCMLLDRDYLIMVSDGFTSDGGKWLTELLNQVASTAGDCFGITDALIRAARELGIETQDDLTVIAVQILKNR